jgi:hypothetical protein
MSEKMTESLSRVREQGNRVSDSALSRMISGSKRDDDARECENRPDQQISPHRKRQPQPASRRES